jgi:hypothetical protein
LCHIPLEQLRGLTPVVHAAAEGENAHVG